LESEPTEGRRADIKGSKAKGVYLAMEFLTNVREEAPLGKGMMRAIDVKDKQSGCNWWWRYSYGLC